MGKTIKQIQTTGWFILVLLISSCRTATMSASTPTITPSSTSSPIETSHPIPVFTTSAMPAIPIKSHEQVFTDPFGWYSVHIPSEWVMDETTGLYTGESGFFEAGYLPEMMFMQHPVDVCQWIANIDTESMYSIWAPTYLSEKASNCYLSTLPEIRPATFQAIIKNPVADNEHRFFFIKTDSEHFERIIDTFTWLQPIDRYKVRSYQPEPLRPEDESFWKNTTSIPAGFSIQEYALPTEAQDKSPSKEIFLKFIPEYVPTPDKSTIKTNVEPDVEEQLMALGYEIIIIQTNETYNKKLYKDGILLFEHVYDVSDVYTFLLPSGTLTAFVVETVNTQSGSPFIISYLIINDVIFEWGDTYLDPPFAPVLHKGELLWIRAIKNAHVQVQNSDQDNIFTFATYFGTHLPVNRFRNWNDHWILEVGSFIVQDGEILNEKFGFEETFNWYLVNEKPFYFFRKGPRVGISFDGQFLPVYYDYVPHGFCCGIGLNNPFNWGNEIRFFGNRDGVWYHVIVEIE